MLNVIWAGIDLNNVRWIEEPKEVQIMYEK